MLWKCVPVLVVMTVPCMAQELLTPPYVLRVEVVADDTVPVHVGTDQVKVRVSAQRLGEEPVKCSVVMLCSAFDRGTQNLSEDEVAVLREASQAARAGTPFKKDLWPEIRHRSKASVFESVMQNDKWVVTMTRGGRVATFLPEELDRLDRALVEGRAAERWYRALLSKGAMPEETPETHPPFSEGLSFQGRIGKVAGRGLEFSAMIWISPDPGKSRIDWSVRGEGRSVGGEWAAEIPGYLAEALAAVRRGQPYLFEHDDFSVMGNRDTKEAELALDKGLRGAFDEVHLRDIEKLKAAGDARILWFQRNERLFFKPVKKAR
jgi:hypothetical protein